MSEMVERGAKAMYERKFRAEGYKWEDSTAQDEWRELMRTALLAMRDPTEGMCAAGQQVNNLSEEPGHFEFLSRDETAAAWQAMINEALK